MHRLDLMIGGDPLCSPMVSTMPSGNGTAASKDDEWHVLRPRYPAVAKWGRTRFRSFLAAGVFLLGLLAGPRAAQADVVILSNRAPALVKFYATRGKAPPKVFQLGVGDILPFACEPGDEVQIAFASAGARREYTLEPNSIYFFHTDPTGKKLDLQQIAITDKAHPKPPREPEAKNTANDQKPIPAGPPKFAKVTVKILVDDDEKAVRAVWEARLRKRIADASAILEKYAGFTLEVVAVGTWDTQDDVENFHELLREFEASVKPDPADVAIGFASQYTAVSGRVHLGGTRGPLQSHILLRESSRQVTEPERLELLVHELGHRFGAAHSPESTSVMRPVLADRKAVSRRFIIVFDPINALAMYLVAEELRERQIERLYQVSPRTRDVLVSIYLTLGKAFPQDPAANQYLALLGEGPPATMRPGRRPVTLIESTRIVRDAIVDAADRNRRLPRGSSSEGGPARLTGDALTERYVRAAATATIDLPEGHRVKAFALGLAVALVDTDSLDSNSLTRELLSGVETPEQRERRLEMLGTPTLCSRNDLVRHYFFSLAMATLASSSISETAGVLKEMRDSRDASGFSFADIAADLSGIALADYVRGSDERVAALADSFVVEDFMPSIAGLPEKLSTDAIQKTYGSISDPRFRAALDEVRARVRKLPVYSTTAATRKLPPSAERQK